MSEQQQTLQAYNKAANELIERLKKFFSYENGKLAGTKVSYRTCMKGRIIPVVKFIVSNNATSRLIGRLKSFGFPVPNINNDIAEFENINNLRQITTSVGKPSADISDDEINTIKSKVDNWISEKVFEGITVAGSGFIRVQNAKLAKNVCTFLKSIFSSEYKIFCVNEDIFFEPKKLQRLENSKSKNFKDYIISIMTDIFKVQIFDCKEINGNVIVALQSEKDFEDAKDFSFLCDIACESKGTTLSFPVTTSYPSLDEVRKLFETKPHSSSQNTLSTEETNSGNTDKIVLISEKDFFAEVRVYVDKSGYEKRTGTSLNKAGSYTYRVGMKDDPTDLIKKAKIDNPSWNIERASPKKNWVVFSLKVKPEEQKITPVNSEKNNTGVKITGLGKRILNKVDKLRRDICSPKAPSADISWGLTVIKEIGATLGLNYKSVMAANNINGRYVNWDNNRSMIEKVMDRFIKLGYNVVITDKDLMRFKSVFPTIIGGESKLDTEKVSIPESTSVIKKQSPKKSDYSAGDITIKLSQENIQSVLSSVSNEDLLSEVDKRSLDIKLSNDQLIAEAKKRGPEFGQLFLQALYKG